MALTKRDILEHCWWRADWENKEAYFSIDDAVFWTKWGSLGNFGLTKSKEKKYRKSVESLLEIMLLDGVIKKTKSGRNYRFTEAGAKAKGAILGEKACTNRCHFSGILGGS